MMDARFPQLAAHSLLLAGGAALLILALALLLGYGQRLRPRPLVRLAVRGGGWVTPFPARSPPFIALAFLFAAGTGVFFGFYPARKAALLKPVKALWHE